MALVFGVKLQYQQDGDEPLGTGGAIKNCEKLILSDDVLVFNGDILTNIDITAMMEEHNRSLNPATIALVPVEDPSQFGVAVMTGNNKIVRFIEKPKDFEGDAWINAGIYIFKKEVITDLMASGFSMVEKDLFPMLASARLLGGYKTDNYWLDIGTHERYEQAQEDAKKYFQA